MYGFCGNSSNGFCKALVYEEYSSNGFCKALVYEEYTIVLSIRNVDAKNVRNLEDVRT